MISVMIKLAGSLLSTIGGSRLTVLIYHRVLPNFDPLRAGTCYRETFEWQMDIISRYFNVLPLGRAVELMKKGLLPARSACITFDDGYADNVSIGLPILEHFDLRATFFVATGYLDGGCMWNDAIIESIRKAPCCRLDLTDIGFKEYEIDDLQTRRATISDILQQAKYLPELERQLVAEQTVDRLSAKLPDDLMMSSNDLQVLVGAGMEIGGHTETHPILANLDEQSARDEIVTGKECLENITGRRVEVFAYPNGQPGRDYDSSHTRLLRDLGFTAAVSTARGVATNGGDFFQIPRFTPWDRTRGKFLFRLLHNYLRTQPTLC